MQILFIAIPNVSNVSKEWQTTKESIQRDNTYPSTTDAGNISTNTSTSTSEISLPHLQLNSGVLPTESMETMIETLLVDREKLKLAFKVDNLK